MPKGKPKACSSLKKNACVSRKTCVYDKRCKPAKKSKKKTKGVKKSKGHKKHRKSVMEEVHERLESMSSKKHSTKKHSAKKPRGSKKSKKLDTKLNKSLNEMLREAARKHSRKHGSKHSVADDFDKLMGSKKSKKVNKPKKRSLGRKGYNKYIGNMRRSGLSMAAAQKAYREYQENKDRDNVHYDVGGLFDTPAASAKTPKPVDMQELGGDAPKPGSASAPAGLQFRYRYR
jgi:hypothetical protein